MESGIDIRLDPLPLSRLDGGENLFQSCFWGALKSAQGWTPRGFRVRSGEESAPLLVLTREYAPGFRLAYVPAGPDSNVPPESQGPFLEALSGALGPHLRSTLVNIRYDLVWRSPYPAAQPRPEPRVREMRMNFGTQHWNLRKTATDIQAPDTIVIDLKPTENELLARMRPKTRYNIRLSARRAVRVVDRTEGGVDEFYRMYAETARRNGIRLHDAGYFRQIVAASRCADRPDPDSLDGTRDRDGTRGRDGSVGAPVDIRLLFAEHRGTPLAGMILAMCGGVATYLYGASRTTGRSLMPTYALQWAAMRLARSAGCRSYDLFGVAPSASPDHPMYGLLRFKSGFGGDAQQRRGCWDYPLDHERYREMREQELVAPGYHSR